MKDRSVIHAIKTLEDRVRERAYFLHLDPRRLADAQADWLVAEGTEAAHSRAAYQALTEQENSLDKEIDVLPLFRLPLRSVLMGLFGLVDALFQGNRVLGEPARPDIGMLAVNRLSYLLPHLRKCCDKTIGASASDVIGLLGPQQLEQQNFAIQYAQLCELMPDVHRGILCPVDLGTHTFDLVYKSSQFMDYEVQDIVMSELALPFSIFGDRSSLVAACVAHAKQFPLIQQGFMVDQINELYHSRIHGASHEAPIMTNDGYFHAVGGSYSDFFAFRAAWFAIAEFCLAMSDAMTLIAGTKHDHTEREAAMGELLEWVGVFLDEDFLRSLVLALSGATQRTYEGAMSLFAVSPPSAAGGGDGFFPPFWRLGSALLFNPNIVRTMLSSRNIPYALNRLDRQRFDELVSGSMEPALIEQAVGILREIDSLVIRKNVKWDAGEIDLLVYSPLENTALQIQAKAAIPPHGVRMLRAVEQRIAEGVCQLGAFRNLAATTRDGIISKAVGLPVTRARIVDLVLCRSCVGSRDSWAALEAVGAVNLPLLRGAVDVVKHGGLFSELPSHAYQVLREVVHATFEGWHSEEVILGDLRLRVPTMQLCRRQLNAWRVRLWEGRPASRP
jgi:hypothetical protein